MVLAARVECSEPRGSDVSRDSADVQRRLRRLVEDEYSFVWRSLRRLGVEPKNAEDAAQHVFITLSNKLDKIAPQDERRYLFGVVVRVASNARRSQARLREVDDERAAEPLDESMPADAILEKREARALLDRALGAMTEDLRVVFTLFELEEMTLVEIAAVLDVPLGTATSRLRRAREQFRTVAARMRGKADV
ncbi:MAG: sigma-70 family RNA polymerase sigma factor [Labilithrix sp.]|nr:sigma-70 family RNA polymerase sigma factor [Labilithrix sp.]